MSSPLTKHDGTDVVIEMPGVGITFAASNTVPADASTGYAKGAIYQHLDASTAATTLYVNTGSSSSASFRALYPFTQGAALTAAKPTFTIADAEGSPDESIQAVINSSAYGFASAAELITFIYKVQNLHTRVGEIEARLEAARIVAAN